MCGAPGRMRLDPGLVDSPMRFLCNGQMLDEGSVKFPGGPASSRLTPGAASKAQATLYSELLVRPRHADGSTRSTGSAARARRCQSRSEFRRPKMPERAAALVRGLGRADTVGTSHGPLLRRADDKGGIGWITRNVEESRSAQRRP